MSSPLLPKHYFSELLFVKTYFYWKRWRLYDSAYVLNKHSFIWSLSWKRIVHWGPHDDLAAWYSIEFPDIGRFAAVDILQGLTVFSQKWSFQFLRGYFNFLFKGTETCRNSVSNYHWKWQKMKITKEFTSIFVIVVLFSLLRQTPYFPVFPLVSYYCSFLLDYLSTWKIIPF